MRQGGVNITLVTPIAHDTPPYDEHIVDNTTLRIGAYIHDLISHWIELSWSQWLRKEVC